MSQRPRRSKANLHPGQIVLDSQIQRRTSEQKQADDENLQQAKEAELAATQKAYECVGAMESAMAARQIQGGLEKPIKPKPRPQSTGQGKSGLETEIKSGTAKDHEQADIGPKAREKTILKLRSAIDQARKRADAETEPSATKDTDHEQAEVASKPREDKIMSKLRGAIEKASKPPGKTASSGHVQATCGNKVANIHDAKSGIEGRVKNWNEVVMTPLSDAPRKRHWGFSEIDPLTPEEDRDYEECKDQTAIVIDDEDSDVENVGKADAFGADHVDAPVPTAPNLKRKRSSSVGDNSEHITEVDTAYEEETEMVGGIARGLRVTSKTSVSAIDAVEPRRADKGIGPGHRIVCHRVQKSRSSIVPSVASDSVPASDFPESEATRCKVG